jgi:hypothetical protein
MEAFQDQAHTYTYIGMESNHQEGQARSEKIDAFVHFPDSVN